MRQLRRVWIVGALMALLAVVAAPASAGVDRFGFPLEDNFFTCDGVDYHVTEGGVEVVVHERSAAQGNYNLNVTVRFSGVLLVDGDENEFRLVGGESNHERYDGNGVEIFHAVQQAQVVSTSGGGTVGWIGVVSHSVWNQNNLAEFSVTFGECDGPHDPSE